MGKNKHKKHHTDSLSNSESGGLKLILKVGNAPQSSDSPPSVILEEPSSLRHYHKKKKKKKDKKKEKKEKRKKKRKCSDHSSGSSDEEEEDDSIRPLTPLHESTVETIQPPPLKKKKYFSLAIPSSGDSTPTLLPEPTVPPCPEETFERPLDRLLEYLLPLLQKKDSNGFFSFPISDEFAPGYSSVIKEPMDFSTMRTKISKSSYPSVDAFREDFFLMCSNALVYNAQDTVYYKAAKRLSQLGSKILRPDKLQTLKDHLPYMSRLTISELGFDLNETPEVKMSSFDVQHVINDIRETVKRSVGRFEARPDDMSPEEILRSAQEAAKKASDRLKAKKPRTQLGYLTSKPDGACSFVYVTGSVGLERPVTVNGLLSRIKHGVPLEFSDNRRSLAESVAKLYTGDKNKNYESVFENLNKEESELVTNTYGDEVGVAYAESILNFGKHCDYAMCIVDHLLDILTGNEHRNTSKLIKESKNIKKEEELLVRAIPPPVDVDYLKTLSNDGIEVGFLENFRKFFPKPLKDPVLLNRNAELIKELVELRKNPGSSRSQESLVNEIRLNLTRITGVMNLSFDAIQQILSSLEKKLN